MLSVPSSIFAHPGLAIFGYPGPDQAEKLMHEQRGQSPEEGDVEREQAFQIAQVRYKISLRYLDKMRYGGTGQGTAGSAWFFCDDPVCRRKPFFVFLVISLTTWIRLN